MRNVSTRWIGLRTAAKRHGLPPHAIEAMVEVGVLTILRPPGVRKTYVDSEQVAEVIARATTPATSGAA
jgi:hypothetical protein